jgi:hypothetical protein
MNKFLFFSKDCSEILAAAICHEFVHAYLKEAGLKICLSFSANITQFSYVWVPCGTFLKNLIGLLPKTI